MTGAAPGPATAAVPGSSGGAAVGGPEADDGCGGSTIGADGGGAATVGEGADEGAEEGAEADAGVATGAADLGAAGDTGVVFLLGWAGVGWAVAGATGSGAGLVSGAGLPRWPGSGGKLGGPAIAPANAQISPYPATKRAR